MLPRTFIVPPGHGSRWLDPDSLELEFRQREDADEPAAPSALPGWRASEPLRHRPFARLSTGERSKHAS
jgi:hypothetical protein